MEVLIGLILGAVAAVALLVMWRMAEHLRQDIISHRDYSPDEGATSADFARRRD